MNYKLLDIAKTHIPSLPLLINVVAKRVAQMNMGMRPMVRPLHNDEDKADLALREIIEGKLTAEIEFKPTAQEASI